MKGMRGQKGFTLIELIVVIVILGILAATALPKFVNLGGNARFAVMQGVEGSMHAANGLIYASAALAQPNILGKCGGAPATVLINNVSVVTCFGYANDVNELIKVMDLAPLTDFNTTAAFINSAGAGVPGSCQIGYTPPGAVGQLPTYLESTNPLTPAGCL
jgi:MSHA pilin protein MshA